MELPDWNKREILAAFRKMLADMGYFKQARSIDYEGDLSPYESLWAQMEAETDCKD